MQYSRFVLKLGLLCALLCSVAWSSASASRGIRLASGGALTVNARGPATLNVSGVNIICTVDGAGVIEPSIPKTVGARVGTLFNGGTISNCNGGYSGTKDNIWTVTYLSFGGSLPSNITSANGLATGVLFTATGGTVFGTNRCQFRSNPTVTISGPGTSFSGGSFSGPVAYNAGPASCPRSGRITNAALTLYGTLTSVAVTLF